MKKLVYLILFLMSIVVIGSAAAQNNALVTDDKVDEHKVIIDLVQDNKKEINKTMGQIREAIKSQSKSVSTAVQKQFDDQTKAVDKTLEGFKEDVQAQSQSVNTYVNTVANFLSKRIGDQSQAVSGYVKKLNNGMMHMQYVIVLLIFIVLLVLVALFVKVNNKKDSSSDVIQAINGLKESIGGVSKEVKEEQSNISTTVNKGFSGISDELKSGKRAVLEVISQQGVVVKDSLEAVKAGLSKVVEQITFKPITIEWEGVDATGKLNFKYTPEIFRDGYNSLYPIKLEAGCEMESDLADIIRKKYADESNLRKSLKSTMSKFLKYKDDQSALSGNVEIQRLVKVLEFELSSGRLIIDSI